MNCAKVRGKIDSSGVFETLGGFYPAVRTIFRRLEKRLVSSPFMLMHKRAYSNDNRVFVLPALN